MNLYPRSFLRLILIGWVVMALPLLLAIAFASISMGRLAAQSEDTVKQASQAGRLGWELEEDLVHMERTLRQHDVLRDPALLDDYAAASRQWRDSLQQFAAIPMLSALSGQATDMLAIEREAHRRFSRGETDSKPLHAALADLKGRSFELLDAAGQRAEEERQKFRAEAEYLQQRLVIALIAALLLAAILFWFGRRIVARLLNSIERAVIALGNNLLERQIRLKGPDDLRWIGKRLDWLRRRLLGLEQERTRILRHISHELKTPLAVLREGSSLLNEGVAGPLTPQQARIAGIMQGNALRLQALIDGLLKLQQAEHARERIQPVEIRLDQLVQDALETHRLAARDKHLHISGTLAPLTVIGGLEEVTTIVHNLLSNAIKFSPEQGSVRVLLSREAQNAVLEVIDSGPGIPDADRGRIFEPFYRSPDTKGVAGVGLGLAIAHEFAIAHRGSLDAIAADTGAHMRARLPLAGQSA
jgi:two-component system sensor histidine kinase GlrK